MSIKQGKVLIKKGKVSIKQGKVSIKQGKVSIKHTPCGDNEILLLCVTTHHCQEGQVSIKRGQGVLTKGKRCCAGPGSGSDAKQ